MDRRVRTLIRAALLAAVGAAGLLLAACSNVNLVQLLTTEVMRATNKFLVIQSVDPVNGAANVDPGYSARKVWKTRMAASYSSCWWSTLPCR